MHEEEVDRPNRVKRILNAKFMKTGRDIENKHENEALEPEEVMAMVEEADTTRVINSYLSSCSRPGHV